MIENISKFINWLSKTIYVFLISILFSFVPVIVNIYLDKRIGFDIWSSRNISDYLLVICSIAINTVVCLIEFKENMNFEKKFVICASVILITVFLLILNYSILGTLPWVVYKDIFKKVTNNYKDIFFKSIWFLAFIFGINYYIKFKTDKSIKINNAKAEYNKLQIDEIKKIIENKYSLSKSDIKKIKKLLESVK